MPIQFSARIDAKGEVELNIAPIPFTRDSLFIRAHSDRGNEFNIRGVSDDKIVFQSSSFHITKFGHSDAEGSHLNLGGFCSQASFTGDLTSPALKPTLAMRLKGFQNFRVLQYDCRLGLVTMVGATELDNPDTLTGYISVSPAAAPPDLVAWRTEAENLLEHIRKVMSFASATVLQGPIIELYANSQVEVEVLSQPPQSASYMRIFHYLHQQSIFETAVKSFVSPPFPTNNLHFAMEWFAMDAKYDEMRLVNAMTALENLIASNLHQNDTLIRPAKEFEKTTRKVLRASITECIGRLSLGDAEKAEVITELNEKLIDLNRKSLIKKLNLLAAQWSVPLDGIPEDKIKAAKRARDHIVHRGHYKDQAAGTVFEHATVIREIVVRFIFSALGFKGSYYSHLGGYHDAHFPP